MSDILDQLRTWANANSDVQFLVIYGSFASGNATAQSDVDIALAQNQVLSFETKVKLINELTSLLKREIDLVDIRTATGTLLNQILTKCNILKPNPDLQAALLRKMWFDHEDFEKQRNVDLEKRRKKIFHG